MANNWSKLKVFNTTDTNCYETLHCWDESCSRVFANMMLTTTIGTMKFYTIMYILPLVLKRKFSLEALIEVLKNASTSSLVLSTVISSIYGMTCTLNHGTGKIYYSSPFLMSMLIHSLVYKFERTSRRNSITMFSMKSVGEIIFSALDERGNILKNYPSLIRFLSILLFSSSVGINHYILKKVDKMNEKVNNNNLDSNKNVPIPKSNDTIGDTEEENPNKATVQRSPLQNLTTMVQRDPLVQILTFITGTDKFDDGNSSSFIKSTMVHSTGRVVKCFATGYLIQSSLILVKYLQGRSPGGATNMPSHLRSMATNLNSIKFGLYLSTMSFTHRALGCLLNSGMAANGQTNKTAVNGNNALQESSTGRLEPQVSSFLSGFASSFISSYLFYDSNQVTLYSFWKTAFTLYWYLLRNNDSGQKVMNILALLSNSIVVQCLVLEPQYLSSSYLRFMDSITGNALRKLNIIVIEELTGNVNTKRYGTKIPNLKAEYLSEKYLSLAGVWSVEGNKI